MWTPGKPMMRLEVDTTDVICRECGATVYAWPLPDPNLCHLAACGRREARNTTTTEEKKMKTSEVLNKAADLIEERGWTAGPAGMLPEGPHCIQGAIQAAAGANTWETTDGRRKYNYLDAQPCAAGEAVRDHIAATSFEGVWIWNDDEGSAERVIEVLRACAVIEAAREEKSAPVEVTA